MNVGLVTANLELVALLQAVVQECGHKPFPFASLMEAIEAEPGMIFCEWREGSSLVDRFQGLQANSSLANPIPVVALVSTGGVVAMRRARAAGAADALVCPPDLQEIRAEMEDVCAQAGKDSLDRSLFLQIARETLVGESANFRKCLEQLRRAAKCDANILLVGETGTGKEMVAQAIHRLSHRSATSYVAVNCAGLPGTLLESELFGHGKGAFTGAHTERAGRFEVVGAGTLLLDEIGDLELPLQIKLLRVIEQREFQRLGQNTVQQFNGRLICATSVDLDAAVDKGRFRRDLLGRVDQFRITLPPLRERKADIPNLIRHFLRKHRGARQVEVSRTAMDLLESFDFPMNVRQLENALVGALARSHPGSLILPQHLPKEVSAVVPLKTREDCYLVQVPKSMRYAEARTVACREIDRLYLGLLLAKHHGNQSRAAEEARIDRGTFADRIKEAVGNKGGLTDG
jgi:DNA-binding NtrC family response regulator